MVTSKQIKQSISYFKQAVLLQSKMYDLVNELRDAKEEELASKVSDGAFKMDAARDNLEEVAKEMIEMKYGKGKGPRF